MAYFFIVNPVAGAGSAAQRFSLLEQQLRRKSVAYEVHHTENTGHAHTLALKALSDGFGAVVVCGGDGTVHEVAQALVHSQMPLGILPLGTGNDLAKALRIPENPDRALALILEGKTRRIDAASANGSVFINVSGFGFDVDTLIRTEAYKKRFGGTFSYLLGVLHALTHIRYHRAKITCADGTELHKEILLVAIGNGNCYGGGMRVTPLAHVNDGLLDVCIIEKVGRLRFMRLFHRFIKGKHLSADVVSYLQTPSLSIQCNTPTPVQLDGEIVNRTPVEYKVLANALTVIAPAESHKKQPS